MLRVTGRPEHAAQKAPPWGYGDTFDESKLPPALQQLANKVRSIPGLHLGALRDVTINYRHSYFFRLDPHIDPALDGESVFIIGLDSDAVLTLCPDKWWKLTQAWNMVRGVLTMEDERDLIKRQNQRSWTPYDLDVLMKKASLVLISGDARWSWTHGTRLGIEVPGKLGLHDWWGSPEHIIYRNPERHSVVLAFAKPEGDKHTR
eukprot:jgi/Chrzof1/9580/Cz04g08080.t1